MNFFFNSKRNCSLTIMLIFFLISSQMIVLGLTEESSLYEKYVQERGILRRGIIGKFFENYLSSLKSLYENNFLELIRKNPSAFNGINRNITNSFIFILEPICIIALLVIGLYTIILSGTAGGRAYSKSLIPGLLLALLFIPLSTYLMHYTLEITDALTREILALSPSTSVQIFTGPIDFFMDEFLNLNDISFLYSIPFIIFSSMLLILNIALFVIRFLLVTFFLMIIPLTIFLYLFLPTREFGKKLLEITLSWTFLQVISAVVLVAIAGTILSLPFSDSSEEIKILFEIVAIITFPIITIFSLIVFRNYLPG